MDLSEGPFLKFLTQKTIFANLTKKFPYMSFPHSKNSKMQQDMSTFKIHAPNVCTHSESSRYYRMYNNAFVKQYIASGYVAGF
jgi:hypothetical protein